MARADSYELFSSKETGTLDGAKQRKPNLNCEQFLNTPCFINIVDAKASAF
jgi:hypothetical protein